MNKTLLKISNKLNNHDTIIMACSTFGCKYILTLEKGINMYWLRVYKDGKLYKQKYWEHLAEAIGSFYSYKRDPDFKYNNYTGGLKYYVHE